MYVGREEEYLVHPEHNGQVTDLVTGRMSGAFLKPTLLALGTDPPPSSSSSFVDGLYMSSCCGGGGS